MFGKCSQHAALRQINNFIYSREGGLLWYYGNAQHTTRTHNISVGYIDLAYGKYLALFSYNLRPAWILFEGGRQHLQYVRQTVCLCKSEVFFFLLGGAFIGGNPNTK